MQGPYVITPYLWPIIAAASLLLTLTVAGLKQRAKAGALPYAMAAFFSAMLMIGAALELSAVAVEDKFFWVMFQTAWMLPAVTAVLLFALEFADPGRRLPAWIGGTLSIPPILMAMLILTNDQHHLFWQRVAFDLNVHTTHSFIGWLFIIYAYLLTIGTLFVLIRVFIQSPVRRRPVALIVTGVIINRAAFILDVAEINVIAPLDWILLSIVLSAIFYGIALFRYDIFDPIPMARDRVIAQMREGMLVLDTAGRVIESNPEAQTILGRPADELKGQALPTLLPLSIEPSRSSPSLAPQQAEIMLGNGPSKSTYSVMLSAISETRGQILGYLLLFHDVTEQKRAQSQLMEQQRVVATMQERERLARELHDSLGQALAATHLQASTAKMLFSQGQVDQIGEYLDILADTTLQAEADMREYLLGTQALTSIDNPFFVTLRAFLGRFSQQYNLPVELGVPPELEEQGLPQTVGIQLLRIIQEALSNVRKHARASSIMITISVVNDVLQVAICDNGQGFKPAAPVARLDGGYGLRSMSERAEGLGGSVGFVSHPDLGTQVIVKVPLTRELKDRT